MRTIYATVAITFMVGSTVLSAATYKGQKIYIESCKECHGGGQEFAASKKQRVWEKLADIHLSSKKAQASWEYFDSRDFTRGAKHLEDFLIEYAGDSGNVPACN